MHNSGSVCLSRAFALPATSAWFNGKQQETITTETQKKCDIHKPCKWNAEKICFRAYFAEIRGTGEGVGGMIYQSCNLEWFMSSADVEHDNERIFDVTSLFLPTLTLLTHMTRTAKSDFQEGLRIAVNLFPQILLSRSDVITGFMLQFRFRPPSLFASGKKLST